MLIVGRTEIGLVLQDARCKGGELEGVNLASIQGRIEKSGGTH